MEQIQASIDFNILLARVQLVDEETYPELALNLLDPRDIDFPAPPDKSAA